MATVVDTTAYDVLLGMEFMKVVKGVYDFYTEKFIYRWEEEISNLHFSTVSAPCHSTTPPLVAETCFSGLISSEAELQVV